MPFLAGPIRLLRGWRNIQTRRLVVDSFHKTFLQQILDRMKLTLISMMLHVINPWQVLHVVVKLLLETGVMVKILAL